ADRPAQRGAPVAASAADEPASAAAPAIEAPQQDPGVVERIITNLTEQVKQEAAQEAEPQRALKARRSESQVPVGMPPPAVDEEAAAPLQKLFLPNTFTPNNDGINDAYVVPMEGLTSVMMRVYSIKTNQLVFATNSGEPWTGANCEDGMYLVAVEAMTTDGRILAEGKVVYLNRSGTN
ncbi:MAG: gliding motility-associated C-terminal domain-containing protein, partial [Flavobacteriales bacterium]